MRYFCSYLKSIYCDKVFLAFFLPLTIAFSLIFYPILCRADSSGRKSSVEALADLSIEQLMSIAVSSTTFFDVAPEKAPGSIYLVSQKLIDNSYASSISDFLEYYVPGVHISGAYSSGSLYSTRGIASPSNSTTLFMLNGTNINVSSGTGINTNLDLPLLGDIERIEVLKGPCSIIHGSGSINGFINVIQKNGADNIGGFVNTEAGFTDGLLKAETGYGSASAEYGDIFLYAGGVKSDGINQSSNKIDQDKLLINKDFFPDINTKFSLNWNWNNFSLTGVVLNEMVESTIPWKPAPAPPPPSIFNQEPQSESFSNSNKEVEMQNIVLLPRLNLEITDREKLSIELPVQYSQYDPAAYFSSVSAAESEYDSELQLKANLILKTTRFADHRIAFGTSNFLKRFKADDILLYVPCVVVSESDDFKVNAKADLRWLETSIFIEDNYQITKKLNLFAGLRHDSINRASFDFKNLEDFSVHYIQDNGEIIDIEQGSSVRKKDAYSLDILIPRFGITYDIDDNKTLKFVYQEGYHYPDYITVMKSMENKNYDPFVSEQIESYELSYYQNFMSDTLHFNLNFYGNIFNNTIMLPIDDDLNGFRDIQVANEFISTGFETALRFTPNSTTSMEISYSLSKPYDVEDEAQTNYHLVNSSGDHWRAFPEHTVKMNINRSFINDKLAISLGSLFNSPIDTADKNIDLFDHNRFILNIGLRYRFTDRFSTFIKGKNIFNNDVPAAGYYYNLQNYDNISLEEPAYSIGLRWEF